METYTDFAMPGEMGLKYERYYTSANSPTWNDNFNYYLDLSCGGNDGCRRITLHRPDGSTISFDGPPNGHLGDYPEDGGDGLATLTHNADDTYTIHDEDATTQVYDDGYGFIQSIKDNSGVGWTFSRSAYAIDYTLTVTHTNGQTVTVQHQALTNNGTITQYKKTVTDPAGNVYVYLSTPYNEMTSATLPGAPATVVSYQYGLGGLTEVDVNGVPYELTTYLNGRVSSNRMADGTQLTSIVYGVDTGGSETATITNPLGHVSTNVYGGFNGLLSSRSEDAVSDCGSTVNARVYDSNGNLAKTTDNNGNIHTYTYAANGQLQTETEAYGTSQARTTDYVWDPDAQLNRPLSVTVEGWSKTVYTYNAQNRVASVAVSNLSGNGTANQTLTTSYQYTLYANGMVHTLKVTHPSPGNSNADVFTYDALGNLTSTVNGLGQTTTYGSYNGLGESGHIVGPNGNVTDYTYDARGRIVTRTAYPDGAAATWHYAYDGFDLLRTLTAPDGEVTTWNRNAVMQVTSITHNDKDGTSTESFGYDANGDVTSHVVKRGSDISLSETMLYDALGRLYQKQGMHGQTVTYGYDGNGNVVSTVDAAGHAVNYQFNALDQLTKAVESGGASLPIVDSTPTLGAPGNSNTGTYAVSWSGVSGATSYVLQQQIAGGSWTTVQQAAATSWAATGEVDGSYGYKVRACNVTGCGPWSAISTTTVLLPPANAPVLSAPSSNITGSYTVSWTAVSHASNYVLQQQTNGGSWATIQTSAATSWIASGKTNGSYGYRSQACNAGGCGPWSNTSVTTVALPPSSAPSLSVPGSSTTGRYTASWTAVSSASSYTLQQQTNGGAWTVAQTGATRSWAASSKPSGSYGYKVQACNASGCGPWSGVGTVVVALPPVEPSSVTAPSYVHGVQYYVSWPAVTTATAYNVLRSNLDTGGSSIVATTSATSATMQAPGSTEILRYAVRACNASGCSAYRSAANTTATDPPGPIH
ncbi:RHS repeat protein [Rhodanobacter sp. T12-5]|nr:RHS repeat protein [Rhodanobacter sp. T12-5]